MFAVTTSSGEVTVWVIIVAFYAVEMLTAKPWINLLPISFSASAAGYAVQLIVGNLAGFVQRIKISLCAF